MIKLAGPSFRNSFARAVGLLCVVTACADPIEDERDPELDEQWAAEVEADLLDFEADPRAFMNRLPTKLGPTAVRFSAEEIAAQDFVVAKSGGRPGLFLKSAPAAHDQARNVVDSLRLTTLASMNMYRTARLDESPWSDSLWGLHLGSIAWRYADPSVRYGTDWKANTDQVRNTTPANVALLSPAEKYDRLVGDTNRTLTKFNLDAGKRYYEATGKVETWMGIDHGWAQAAFMLPRPVKAVTVRAADGVTQIPFYPSDIKALASALWAGASTSTKFVGGRCAVKAPAVDAMGRIKDPACRDTNAGTFHLAIVNQIGANKRSLILDATYDYEVWNQPIYEYDYMYFNPKTKSVSKNLASAKVAVSAFPEDKFKMYRARGTTDLVGITMNVKWVVETTPSHATPDSPSRDAISGARYLYTLELDAAGTIIGGEWMQNAHPDFLWVPAPGARATAGNEASLTEAWNGMTPVPASWRAAAVSASGSGTPLAAIVEKLTALSRAP